MMFAVQCAVFEFVSFSVTVLFKILEYIWNLPDCNMMLLNIAFILEWSSSLFKMEDYVEHSSYFMISAVLKYFLSQSEILVGYVTAQHSLKIHLSSRQVGLHMSVIHGHPVY
jgi:hypothetical protein